MKKEKVIGFFIELICYIIIVAVLQLIVHTLGWTDTPAIVNIICLTVGWLIWRFITLLIKNKKDTNKRKI